HRLSQRYVVSCRIPPHYLTANTHTAPPSGTSAYSPGTNALSRACIERESIPNPDCTAMYCVPSTMKDEGDAMMPEFVGNSHSTSPFVALNARNLRSFVPPLNTNP